MKIRSRQIGEHREGCYALTARHKRHWRSPWGCIDWSEVRGGSPRVWADAIGRGRRGSTPWLRYVCNDTQCRAVLLVNESDAADAAEASR